MRGRVLTIALLLLSLALGFLAFSVPETAGMAVIDAAFLLAVGGFLASYVTFATVRLRKITRPRDRNPRGAADRPRIRG